MKKKQSPYAPSNDVVCSRGAYKLFVSFWLLGTSSGLDLGVPAAAITILSCQAEGKEVVGMQECIYLVRFISRRLGKARLASAASPVARDLTCG